MSLKISKFNDYKIFKNARIGFEFEFYSKVGYYKLLELLNTVFDPIQIKAATKYHSNISINSHLFKIEPDNSGGDDMIELVTYYLPYYDAKIILNRMLLFLQKYCYTTDKCAIQINVSFTDNDISRINVLKMILNIDEDYIQNLFPLRKGNIYANSIKKIIPYKQFDYVKAGIDTIKNNLILPDTKYYGVNFSKLVNNYLEFRYMGGKDYQYKVNEIIELTDYFIMLNHKCLNAKLDDNDILLLEDYLYKHITTFKKFAILDHFLNAFPNISFYVDKINDYDLLSAYWGKLSERIYDMLTHLNIHNECILNYDTTFGRLELVHAECDIIFELNNVDLISCKVKGGFFDKCGIIDCDLHDTHLYKCNILNSKVTNSKILDTNVNRDTEIYNSFYNGGIFNAKMYSGIYRRGKLGPDAQISKETKKVKGKKGGFFKGDKKSSGRLQDIEGKDFIPTPKNIK